jgi:hypothetical protein
MNDPGNHQLLYTAHPEKRRLHLKWGSDKERSRTTATEDITKWCCSDGLRKQDGRCNKSTEIRSNRLWRWYINTITVFLDIIHRPVFYLKHKVSETGFCLRLQVIPTQLGPIDRGSPCTNTRWRIQTKHSTNHQRELWQISKHFKKLRKYDA